MTSPTSSSPVTELANSTGTVSLDALLAGAKWGNGGAGTFASVTFSFPWTTNATGAVFSGPGGTYSDLDEANASTHYGLNAVQQGAAEAALQSWTNVANIHTQEVPESTTSVGDIRIAWTSAVDNTDNGEAAWGWAYTPDRDYASGGDIWISTKYNDSDWSSGSYNYMSLIHELGHALGLKHPFEEGVTDPAHANQQYSLMAYDPAPHNVFGVITEEADGFYWEGQYVVPDTPMLYDIAAMQYLYGANMSYHTGADTYTFDPSTPFLRTIWDAGGNDTISVANFTNGCVIDLQQGHYSSIHIPSADTSDFDWDTPPPTDTYDGTNNLAIAYGAVIENATGGSGNDTLIGNSIANRLQGNGGSNVLDGGDGIDTAVYTGNFSDYTVTAKAGGYTVSLRTNPSLQTDALSNIERLVFKDGTVSLNMASVADDSLQAQYVALAQKFYVAYFGRPADANGLANMVAQFAAAKVPTTTRAFTDAYYSDATIKALVDSFGNSDESAKLYHGTNVDFVTSIYAHVLGRAPDAEGLKYWAGALDAGGLAHGLAALTIIAGAEANTTPQGLTDAVLIANRITVAANFTATLDLPSEVAGYAGDAAAAAARTLLDGVNQNTSVFAYETNVLSTVAKMAGGALANAPEVVLIGIAGHESMLG